MKKKKAKLHPKNIIKPKDVFRFRIWYLALGCTIILLLLFGGVKRTNTEVLGMSTSTYSSHFSFGNLFSLLFSFFAGKTNTNSFTTNSTIVTTAPSVQVALSQAQLLAMAGHVYASGNLPLGDKQYTTTAPKKGYIYLCNVPQSGAGGAQNAASWIGTTTWQKNEKPTVAGHVSWSNAQFSNTTSGNTRILLGNGLPVGMATGIYPIALTDPAHKYDANPNSIKIQSLHLSLPTNPTYSDTPYCMGMEVGVMLNGVPLFNGFDAELRDAAAHEVQDSCDGHPQVNGEYHYHSLSSCYASATVQTVVGFALDGFPITGPIVASGKYLTTNDLDECHGITSSINLDGKTVTMYHYVLTEDFPYSMSCFRGKQVSYQVISSGKGGQSEKMGQSNSQMQGNISGQPNRQPPQAAVTACSGKTSGTSCSFSVANGTISGTCLTPPNQSSVVCIPANPPRMQ